MQPGPESHEPGVPFGRGGAEPVLGHFGADEALAMCGMLTDQADRFACYQTIVIRAQELYETDTAYQAFCTEVDESFRAWCRSKQIVHTGPPTS